MTRQGILQFLVTLPFVGSFVPKAGIAESILEGVERDAQSRQKWHLSLNQHVAYRWVTADSEPRIDLPRPQPVMFLRGK